MSLDKSIKEANVFVFDTSEQLALAAAQRFVDYSHASILDHNLFSVSLAGGQTPRRVYELLASEPFNSAVAWPSVHLFFGDERCVPPDNPESNYGMVYSTLISKIPIPPNNVHRIIGESDAAGSAELYEKELKSFFAKQSLPRFDLVLLGLGEDSHTASLFPGTDTLGEKARWVVKTRAPGLKQDRITLTIPVFNHAARVMFLITGSRKARPLADVLLGPKRPDGLLPAQAIGPLNGTLEWLIDRQAGSYLESTPVR
ncbi:MAG: 6-phosphogluconolactonase [Pyrinomonadaceae bacterium]